MLNQKPNAGFMRERQLRQRVPVSHSTLWAWVREKKFPAPLKLSERVTVWRVSDIDAWEARQGHA
ncbi:MAG: AlpA family phage regulatory protein [Thiobacillaceae bacterium]